MTNEEKQIEELAEDIKEILVRNFDKTNLYHWVTKDLYTKDYRKASDVAREVIGKIQSKIQIMVSSIKAQEEIGNISEFNGGAKTTLEIVFKDLAELKNNNTCNFCSHDCESGMCRGREDWTECNPVWRGVVKEKSEGEKNG